MRIRRNKWPRRALVALLLAFAALNGVAFMQARAMTHYARGGESTAKPEALTLQQKAWAIATGVKVVRPQNTHTPEDLGLAYSTHSIEVGGAAETLEAWEIEHDASKGVVLMFPGYAMSKDALLAPAAAFYEMGYSPLLVDFRGAGGSSGSDTTLGVREADDVAAALRYAKQKWPGKRTVLYGVSMGSAAILRAVARERAQPDALVLESPFDSLLNTVGNRFHATGLPAFPSAELVVLWGSVQQGFNGYEHNPAEYARSVAYPTLLLHGERDPRVTVEQNTAIFEALRGKKAMYNFPGAAHELLIKEDLATWKEQVGGFLSGASTR